MDLFLCAQDIQFITFGLVKDGVCFHEQALDASPEQYLNLLNRFFSEQKMSSSDIKRIIVVNGPGSFTASRVSVTIANTFAFVHQIPLVALENPDRLSCAELILRVQEFPEHAFVVPVYDRPPHIT